MTAREHAEEAAKAASDADLRASRLKDSGITFAMQAAQAHALVAIALALTAPDEIDYAAVAQEAAIQRVDAAIARHLYDAVATHVSRWADSEDGRKAIDERISLFLGEKANL